MPNSTDIERIMIAVGYSASWYPSPPQKFKVSNGSYSSPRANALHQRPTPEQAPLAAKELLTRQTPADFDWLPDATWEKISQRWGLDEEDGIFLPASPGMAPGAGVGKGWDGIGAEPWDCLNVTATEDKVVNPNFNSAAIGA